MVRAYGLMTGARTAISTNARVRAEPAMNVGLCVARRGRPSWSRSFNLRVGTEAAAG